MIEVSGGESAINQIKTVNVYLNVSNVSDDFTKRLTPAAYDSDGNKITSSTLTFSYDTVKVSASVLEIKKVPVKVKIIGKPAEGVEIAGRPRVLSNISAILIPVEISGMNSGSRKLEQDIMVSDYLPENVTVLDEYSTVSIKIVIEQMFKKKIQIALSDITFGGLEDGYEAIPESDLSNIYIMVAGTASELKKLNTKTVNPYINCRGLDDGTYSIRLQCDVGDECEIISQPKVKVRIKKKS